MLAAEYDTPDSKKLRQFGLLIGALFPLIFAVLGPYLRHHTAPVWPWIVAIVLIVPAILKPNLLSVVYHLWMKFGQIMGLINGHIIMFIVYLMLFLPLGMIGYFLKRDPLKLKAFQKRNEVESYKIKCTDQRGPESMRRIF